MRGPGSKPREARVRVGLTVDNRTVDRPREIYQTLSQTDWYGSGLIWEKGEERRESNTALSTGASGFWGEMVPWVGQT